MKILLVNTDGSKTVLEITPETEYEVLSQSIGGYLEYVHLNRELSMYVHEEGKVIGLPVNTVATKIWWDSIPFAVDDCINGPAVIVGVPDEFGYSTGLTDEQIRSLSAV